MCMSKSIVSKSIIREISCLEGDFARLPANESGYEVEEGGILV